jgi:hypothetical protein
MDDDVGLRVRGEQRGDVSVEVGEALVQCQGVGGNSVMIAAAISWPGSVTDCACAAVRARVATAA